MSGSFLAGVANAAVVGSEQGFDEGVFYASDFAHLQIAFVELAIEQPFHGDFVHERLDAFGRWFLECATGTFDGIGEHEYGGFAGLWSGSRIAKTGLAGIGAVVDVGFTGGFAVEVFDECRAVMLSDEGVEGFGEVVFFGEFQTVLDVADNNQGAHCRSKTVVRILVAVGHVFDEVFGLHHFADVVEIGADAGKKSVGTDGFSCGFSHGSDHDGVIVGAGCTGERVPAGVDVRRR